MTVKKLSRREWAKYIERSMKRYQAREAAAKRRTYVRLRHYLPIPVLIGVVASIFFVWRWGVWLLLQHVLSWVIGITIVTTVIALLGERFMR